MRPHKTDHHYVPEFLLKPWLVKNGKGHNVLVAYYWDKHKNSIKAKDQLGANGYCYKPDLMTLTSHPDGRDFLESVFFERVDNKGSKALQQILEVGVGSLSTEQKEDFSYLLLSLNARRPYVLEKIRTDGPKTLSQALDADPQIRECLQFNGVAVSASEYYEENIAKLEDRALLAVLPYLTKKSVGLPSIMNCYWLVRRLSLYSLKLVFSDRPLVRIESAEHPRRIWCIPLASDTVFLASPNKGIMQGLISKSDNDLVRAVNAEIVGQRDKYVFSVSRNDGKWLEKRFKR